MSNLTTPVTKIQKFCTHDGPGVRTTVFLKGCPLWCQWCHNPEMQSFEPQYFYNERLCIGCRTCEMVCPKAVHRFENEHHSLNRTECIGCMHCAEVCPSGAIEPCSTLMRIDEIFNIVMQDRPFYGKNGGMTLSGGEPMAHPQAAVALLRMAKNAGLHTAMETCGFFYEKWIPVIAPLVDLFLWDFKDGNAERHLKNTGVSNQMIMENLKKLDRYDVRIRLRCIMIKDVNMDECNFSAIADTYHILSHCEGIELLMYHDYGSSKNVSLGLYENGHKEWIPTKKDISLAKNYFKARNVRII